MNETHNSKLTENSQTLRTNMTPQEKHIWYDFLKHLPVTVHRQKVIENYIVDFYIASAKIVVEIDGAQHYKEDGKKADKERDARLGELGITVLRYTNRDIDRRFKGVCWDIKRHLDLL
ncbi:MAG: DUF559 domain-containing protein [Clostridia bacterium]|nr:DUF559 domain-containing protein [Clostridia bacterium]MBR6650519.1 DUF559 domain-containing protein [Clostridia bacterium]